MYFFYICQADYKIKRALRYAKPLVMNHQFNWWFDFGPIRADYLRA